MKLNEKYNIAPEFETLFAFKNKAEEIEHEAKMITQKILSEIDKLNNNKPILKKELAKTLGTSASYITQLYNGTKGSQQSPNNNQISQLLDEHLGERCLRDD